MQLANQQLITAYNQSESRFRNIQEDLNEESRKYEKIFCQFFFHHKIFQTRIRRKEVKRTLQTSSTCRSWHRNRQSPKTLKILPKIKYLLLLPCFETFMRFH